MIRRSLLALLLSLCMAATSVYAQSRYDYDIPLPEYNDAPGDLQYRGQTLHSFLVNPYTGALYSAQPDTLSSLFHDQVKAEGRSIVMAFLGNLRSPWLDMDYFHRERPRNRYLYNRTLSGFLYNESNSLFYNTKTPYAKLFYQRNGGTQQREEQFDFTLAINKGKHFGAGADFNYTYSPGYYIGNRTKNTDYRLYGTVTFDHYEAYLTGGNNYTKITENGGVMDDRYISDPTLGSGSRRNIPSGEIPVRHANNVWNGVNDGFLFLSHRYNFGSQRRRSDIDTLNQWGERRMATDTMQFVPVASIGHILSYTRGRHEYVNRNSASFEQYANQYRYMHRGASGQIDELSFLPYDSTYTWQVDNSAVLSLREGFRPWVKFGLEAYVRLENRYYYQQEDVVQEQGFHTVNGVVGGRIARTSGRLLNFDALLETTVLGEDIGSLHAEGGLATKFRIAHFPIGLRAWGNFENRRPNYFLRHFHGSFHRWDEEFGYERRLALGGELSMERLGLTLDVETATLQNQVYFGADAIARQHSGAVQILAARLRHEYKWQFLGWRLAALYQLSSNQAVEPLPMLSLYGSLHTDFHYANVLRVQLGVDCRWHTNYYAPYYEPAVMQFINQQETQYGNFPHLNAFVSFQLRRTRFFVEYYNLGDLFISPSRRFSAAHYPINPPVLRLGIAMDLNK